jgi:hypothetical protein
MGHSLESVACTIVSRWLLTAFGPTRKYVRVPKCPALLELIFVWVSGQA